MQIILFSDTNAMGYGKYAGPHRLASELRDHGFTVQVVDLFTYWSTIEFKMILNKFVTSETLWLGFSVSFTDKRDGRFSKQSLQRDLLGKIGREDFHEVIDFAKEINPKLKVVVGGAMSHFLSIYDEIDYVVQGQGEVASVKLSQALLKNESLPKVLSDKVFKYSQFHKSQIKWQEQDVIFQGEHLPLEISRGCIFRCAYCAFDHVDGSDDYIKTEETLLSELRYNDEKFKPKGYIVSDDTVNDSVAKVEKLHRIFTSLDHNLIMSSYARADLIIANPHTLDLLYEAGFRCFFFGIETFNKKSGEIIGKGMHPDKMKAGLEWMKKRYPDILISAGIIYGLPGDTIQTLKDTNEYLKSSPIDFATLTPLIINTGSKFAENPLKWGYIIKGPRRWKNKEMNVEQIDEIIADANQFLDKKNKVGWVFASRIMNVGFTLDDCHNLIQKESKDLINEKSEIVKREYFKNLMSL